MSSQVASVTSVLPEGLFSFPHFTTEEIVHRGRREEAKFVSLVLRGQS